MSRKEKEDLYETIMEIINQKDLHKFQEYLDEGLDINTSFSRYHEAGGSFGPVGLCDQEKLFIEIIHSNWMEGFEACVKAGVNIDAPDLRVCTL